MNNYQKSRRTFIKTAGFALTAGVVTSGAALRSIAASLENVQATTDLPELTYGIQFGDVLTDRAIIWSRADSPGKMLVEYSFNAAFKDSRLVEGPLALENTDYTARIDLSGLPSAQTVYVKVSFVDINNQQTLCKPSLGHFRTAPEQAEDIRFLWSGDTCGQGWGINPEQGGMKIFETMRLTKPDFFIHCGDNIYADCPIPETKIIPETGQIWHNLVTPEVAKVAETLAEFRGRYKYNLLDHNLRRFNAEVPTIWLWDDHEITNNWSPTKELASDEGYTETDINKLISLGTTAAMEYAPIRYHDANQGQQIYRQLPYGPLLDVFVLDMRSYRAGNSHNRQEHPGPDTDYFGREQLDWLKASLKNSTAVWKVIAADMSLGLQIGDVNDAQNRRQFDNCGNGDGPVLGREFEIAELLAFVKDERILNMVWLTADVHYCAAQYYDPGKAKFKNFTPFWEFISGPLNAGSFGPHQLDNTFGPQLVFQKSSPTPNLSPVFGLQFFGQVDINSDTQVLTVTLKDVHGESLFAQEIIPES